VLPNLSGLCNKDVAQHYMDVFTRPEKSVSYTR